MVFAKSKTFRTCCIPQTSVMLSPRSSAHGIVSVAFWGRNGLHDGQFDETVLQSMSFLHESGRDRHLPEGDQLQEIAGVHRIQAAKKATHGRKRHEDGHLRLRHLSSSGSMPCLLCRGHHPLRDKKRRRKTLFQRGRHKDSLKAGRETGKSLSRLSSSDTPQDNATECALAVSTKVFAITSGVIAIPTPASRSALILSPAPPPPPEMMAPA